MLTVAEPWQGACNSCVDWRKRARAARLGGAFTLAAFWRLAGAFVLRICLTKVELTSVSKPKFFSTLAVRV